MTYKEYKNTTLILSSILLILIIVIGIIIYQKITNDANYKNGIISFKYSRNFSLNEENNHLELTNDDNSIINISYKELDKEEIHNKSNYRDLITNYITSNNQYKIINNSKTNFNSTYEGESLLFEKDNNNLLIIYGYYNNIIYMITYESNITNFDILLDSVLKIASSVKVSD